MQYADLEIRILNPEADGYPVELTLNSEQQFERGYLDPAFLPWIPSADLGADGERLFAWLCGHEKIKSAWAEVRGQHPQRRLRLRITAAAPDLHALPWELLRDPSDGATAYDLAAASATPFTRYLAGKWQPGSPILQRPIKVLVAIANPANLGDYKLQPLDEEAEWQALRQATADMADVTLVPLPQPCTLPALEAELRKGYHVLHFVGHGQYSKSAGEAALFLANADNQVALVKDDDLATMLVHQLASTDARDDDKLRLVFLAACQSAQQSPADAFRGFAPKLVQAGVPAVLAMQDLVPVETARTFAQVFYRQLLQHGQVDLAANEARATLSTAKLPGAALPVLFVRLRNGQLFGVRGEYLGNDADSFWNTLLDNIAAGECTPFLGAGILRDLLPSPAELAQRLAAANGYPFTDSSNWPRVAQFLGTLDNRRLRREFVRIVGESFKRRLGLPYDRSKDANMKLPALIASTNWAERSHEFSEVELHRQLAELELPLYLTTNFDNFMTLALEAVGKQPRRHTIDWRVDWRKKQEATANRPADIDPPPSSERPVVLHLFGTDDDLLSLVLTEDDYLDYLTRISRDSEYLLPPSVRAALSSTTLLFLGYRLEDLDFKVLMRGLLTNLDLERWGMLHVAVQVEGAVDEAKLKEMTRYFQRYFANARIDLYWGSTQQFIADLHDRWMKRQAKE